MQLRELAERLECRLEGDGTLEISRVASLEHAGEGDVTFFVNPRYAPALRRTRASAVIIGEKAPAAPCAMLRTAHPYLAFANALSMFGAPAQPPSGVATLSAIAPDAVLGRDVSVGPFSSVGRGARIGDRTIIHPNVCHRRGRRRRRRLRHPLARRDPRARGDRQPRDHSERRRDRIGRLRLCQTIRRHLPENPADSRGDRRRRCRNRREYGGRSAGRRRNTYSGRHQNRQPRSESATG